MNKQEFLNYVETIIPFTCCKEVRQFIACQCALESNFGRSAIAKDNNNIIGMRYPTFRVTTAIGKLHDHAQYSSLEYCLIDYGYWLSWHSINQIVLEDFEKFKNLSCWSIYCPNRDYVNRIINLKNQFYE